MKELTPYFFRLTFPHDRQEAVVRQEAAVLVEPVVIEEEGRDLRDFWWVI
ncbi:MAG: hypothetical protein HY731_01790, partial [Candidatus Tectomicrobia bacterium]|nr:hypothetical protein [Candidatus Tectomicrobia bacterium]